MLGGTGWLGSAIVRAAMAGGAEVVCLARGQSGPVPAGARLVRADRRLVGAYDQVRGSWDEVIELSYEPDLVTSALNSLAGAARHWTLISTVSVYARNDVVGQDESAAVIEPHDLTQYPDAKVRAEQVSADRVGDRLLIARPGLIVGPGDLSDRFGYWPGRFRRGGRVLLPTTAGRHVQVIDVDDLAAWTIGAGQARLVGTVNAVGAAHDMNHFFATVGAVTGTQVELVQVDDHILLAQAVQYWAGPHSLPLWLPESDGGFAQRNGAAYLASGGMLRTLGESVSRVLDDEIARGIERPRRSGLTAEEEAAVLESVR